MYWGGDEKVEMQVNHIGLETMQSGKWDSD